MGVSLQSKFCSSARASLRPRRRAVVIASAQLRQQISCATVTAAAVSSALLLGSQAALAVGIESFDLLPSSLEKPAALAGFSEGQKQKLAAAEEAFENSSTLKELLAKSEANKDKNKKEIQNKYCYRQAELGVGDCGGLRYIPGLTESGKQKTPQWLADLLGVEVQDSNATEGKSLRDLIYADGDK